MEMKFMLLVWLSSVSAVDAPGDSAVIGSHKPVKVAVGGDAILPCHLEPPFDMNTITVDWKHNKTIVHVFRNGKDDSRPQDENYRGRTSLFHDEMVRGNISLKLTNVTERDAGNYTCFVPKLHSQVRKGYITLIVEPVEERPKENLGPIGAIIAATIFIVVIAIAASAVLWRKCCNLNMGQDGGGIWMQLRQLGQG